MADNAHPEVPLLQKLVEAFQEQCAAQRQAQRDAAVLAGTARRVDQVLQLENAVLASIGTNRSTNPMDRPIESLAYFLTCAGLFSGAPRPGDYHFEGIRQWRARLMGLPPGRVPDLLRFSTAPPTQPAFVGSEEDFRVFFGRLRQGHLGVLPVHEVLGLPYITVDTPPDVIIRDLPRDRILVPSRDTDAAEPAFFQRLRPPAAPQPIDRTPNPAPEAVPVPVPVPAVAAPETATVGSAPAVTAPKPVITPPDDQVDLAVTPLHTLPPAAFHERAHERGIPGHDLLEEMQFRITPFDEALWRDTCVLFRCRHTARAVPLPGLRSPLWDYQAAAVTRLLVRPPDEAPLGTRWWAALSHEPGMGKTRIALAFAVALHTIWSRWDQVRADWRAGTGQHLPDDSPAPPVRGRTCPAQPADTPGLQCPCIPGSLSRRVVHTLGQLPTAVVSPAALVDMWVREWATNVDPAPDSPAADMLLTVAVGSETYRNTPFDRPHAAWTTLAGRSRWVSVPDPTNPDHTMLRLRRVGLRHATQHVVLLSYAVINRLYDTIDAKTKRPREASTSDDGDVDSMYPVGYSAVFFDEWETVHGSTAIRGEPFEVLMRISDRCAIPPLLVALSWSFLPGGIPAWFKALAYGYHHDGRVGPNWEGLLLEDGMPEVSRAWDQLQSLSTSHAFSDAEWDAQAQLIRDFVKILLQHGVQYRRKTYRYLGRPIVPIPAFVTKHYFVASPDTRALPPAADGRRATAAMIGLVRQVQDWVVREHQAAVGRDARRATPELPAADIPALRAVERRTVIAAALGEPVTGGARKGPKKRPPPCWLRLARCAVFPWLAVMMASSDAIASLVDNARALSNLSTRLDTAFAKPEKSDRDAAVETFFQTAGGLLWDDRQRLRMHSVKYAVLCQVIDTMLARRMPPGDGPPSTPRDEVTHGIHHMVVVVESEIAAFLATMLLWDSFRARNVELRHLHEHMVRHEPNRRQKLTKHKIVHWLGNTASNPAAPNKIVVTTYAMLRTGYNLQHASYVVMLDTPFSMQGLGLA